jgi:hypothetical protein
MNSINALTTTGYTAGQTGIQWGWYTLSPKWKDLWPSSSEPASYSDDDTLKFALVMTDGAFNTFYNKVSWSKNKCENKKKNGEYSGTCKNGTNDYWIEKSSSGYNGASSKRARKLCNKMKNKDIEMYSVYFGSNNSSSEAKVMKACADDGNYYQATSADSLIQAFANIAKKIQQIYISR